VGESPLDRLIDAEGELGRLAAALETVVKQDAYFMVVLALGHRARSIFFAFIHAMESPTPAAAMSLLRPGVEINLLIRFLARDPLLHVELWEAEGMRQRLALINEYEQDPVMLERRGPSPFDSSFKEELKRHVDEARSKALAAQTPGVRERGPLLPSAGKLVRWLDDPGAREAYTLAYRSLGADVHAGSFAFSRSEFVERPGGGVSFHEAVDQETYRPARTLSLTMFASTLCMVAPALNMAVADEADEIKRRFVVEDAPIAERLERLQEGSTGS
jgi:Family of unknown function (DUF5677)